MTIEAIAANKLLSLAERIEGLSDHKRMKFAVDRGGGYIATNSEQAIRTLCDVYNHRMEVAAAIRAIARTKENENDG